MRWQPPRGGRRVGAPWPPVWARSAPRISCPGERDGFIAWRAVLEELAGERQDLRGWSLRRLAEEAGLPLSTVASMEAGSTWPSFRTFAVVADALGYRVQLRLLAEPPILRRPRPPALSDGWAAHETQADAGSRARLWHDLLVAELEWLRRARLETAAIVGPVAGSWPDTVRDAERSVGSDRWASVPLLLGWSRVLGATLTVTLLEDPPRPLVWER